MATIEIHNLYSKVIDASPKALTAIDNALAVETPGYKFTASYRSGYWDGMTRFFNRVSGKFPTGLLSEVVAALRKIGEDPEIVDKRNAVEYTLDDEIKLGHKELGHITLRDYQYECVKKALESSRGIINVATNGGKTEIACGIIKSILPNLKPGDRIAFFTHSKEIFHQSHKRIEERLGIKVGLIGDGKWDEQQVTVVMIPTVAKYIKKPEELPKTKKLKELSDKVTDIQMVLRSKKITLKDKQKYEEKLKEATEALKAYRKEQWDKINDNVKRTNDFLKSIVAFIGDEVHHASSDTWYKIFMSLKNAYYRFGLTGTVDESNEINVKRLLGCTGKIVKKVSNEFLIEKGYSAKPTIYMMSIPAEPIVDVDYMTARERGIIHCSPRNQVFVNKVLERAKSGKQCLIIVNETEHGEIVLDMLKDKGITVKFTHGDKSSKYREEVLEELRNGTLQVLIATSILDEGVDVSGINCLFLMAGGKSMRQLLQRIGRGLRKKEDNSGLEVYDALDYHNEYLVDHTLERYYTYKDEGFEITKLPYQA
jgi:superfamily II DNA or RNA helicase